MRSLSAICAGLVIVANAAGDEQAFTLNFDGGTQDAVVSNGVRFTNGRSGFAAEFVKGAELAYDCGGRFDPTRGTLDLWIRPNWNSRDDYADRYFWGIDSDPGHENRAVLGHLGRDGRGILYFGGDGALGGLATKVDWQAGEWHHVVVCWDEEPRCRALYVDGVLRHYTHFVGGMPREQTRFHVGSLPCVTRWMGVLDGHESDAAIDDLTLSQTIDAPDFDRVRLAASEDLKAIKRFEQSREAARPAYEQAWERLNRSPTLDGVAERQYEAAFEDVTGLAAPMSLRVPIQARYYSDVVYVHPDLSIALGRPNESYAVGFAAGDPFQLPDMYTVSRTLHKGYQPAVESRWDASDFHIDQTAFTILPRDEETVTGDETQYAVVRMAVRNTGDAPRPIPLFLLVGLTEGTQNTNYSPFLASASRWVTPPLGLAVDGDAVALGERTLLTYRASVPVQAEALNDFATGTADPLLPSTLSNAVRFNLELQPNETGTVDFVMAGTSALFPAEERLRMREVTFEAAQARAEAYWDRALSVGMKLTTPEPRLNDIYRHLILSCLGGVTKIPERPWHAPYQSPVWEGVWPWECAHMVVPLCSIGYHREMEPTLKYFTERQTGLGVYAEPGRGPEGEIKSTYGCYSGNFLLRWMCETGSVMWAMAEKYRYSHDDEWLKQNKESILAAWDWIQGERARTRRYTDAGEPAAYFGLLPKGRVHDWNDWHYFFFSDTYTWQGMSTMAQAFLTAGFPEADRMVGEADEYRDCLLAAIEQAQHVDPETGLLFVPNLVPCTPGEQGGLWWADGPACMFGTGLLDARTDPRFAGMFQYLQHTWGTLAGLTNRMDEPKELGKKNPFWYVNSCERGYFQNFLARGETEKALLIFYSNMAYGLSQDCFQTVERIHVSDANYSPFQPNASGNGRMLDMFKRMVIDEQGPGVLWLLRGCPRRWFAPGQSIVVEDAPTYYGPMALRTLASENRVTIDIVPPAGPPLPELRLVVRHPGKQPATRITVNGAEVSAENETIVIKEPAGPLAIVCDY
ncbi:MAG: hypothetical protein IT365_16135 [Candidatus Hydrogenedentes bacterium]|nr:hypothetical protein [Candidatus Hydrogenedentota bacterium]